MEETQSILDSPMSPDMNDTSWNSNIQSTPGVIGAQEVYRLVAFIIFLQKFAKFFDNFGYF